MTVTKRLILFFSPFLLSPKLIAETFIIGSLGDSVTMANNCRRWGDSETNNWSTGSNTRYGVKSHFTRLKEVISGEVKATNVAETGATSEDLHLQVSALLQDNPDYVTLLIGANDACSWRGSNESLFPLYEERLERALTRIIENNFSVKILLVPVPDMLHLWKLGRKDCGWLWDLSGACPDLLSSYSSESQRASFVRRLEGLNRILGKLAKKYLHHVKYDESLSSFKFEKEDVSTKDCFHPSLKGQSKLAKITWENSWF